MDLLVRNGRVFGLGEAYIGVEEGKIAKISKTPFEAEETINASGLFILPGLVDCHVHMREPGQEYKEDFFTGSSAAAMSGVTCILDMPNNLIPITNQKRLDEKIEIAEKKCIIDFGLHFCATDQNAEEILKIKNTRSVKFYMESLKSLSGLKSCAARGLIACVHAEDGQMIKKNEVMYKNEDNVVYHSKIRNPACAEAALEKILAQNPGCKIHICHVSTRAELNLLKNTSFEVTPHHLFLSAKDYKKLGNLVKINPPLRDNADRLALWDALKSENACIATDHAPHTLEEKGAGYWNAPPGVPELDTFLMLLLNEINKKNLTIDDLVRLCCENPAKLFGMEKGKIEIGKDADFVLVDMKKEIIIKSNMLKTKCGWSPYEGRKVRGCAVKTICRGEVVMDGGEIRRKEGRSIWYEAEKEE